MQREQKVSTFKDLVEAGKITRLLWGQSDEIRLWANAEGHEDVEDSPRAKDVDHLLGYLDMVFDTLYVQPHRLEQLRARGTAGADT